MSELTTILLIHRNLSPDFDKLVSAVRNGDLRDKYGLVVILKAQERQYTGQVQELYLEYI